MEKKRKTSDHLTAVEEGVVRTGSVITSSGLILAGTFAVLATLPIQVLVQFGVVTAIGVLLDTFIVRPLLVPAITTILGKYAFWPGALFKKKIFNIIIQGKNPFCIHYCVYKNGFIFIPTTKKKNLPVESCFWQVINYLVGFFSNPYVQPHFQFSHVLRRMQVQRQLL